MYDLLEAFQELNKIYESEDLENNDELSFEIASLQATINKAARSKFSCVGCHNEHQEILDWLKELQDYRNGKRGINKEDSNVEGYLNLDQAIDHCQEVIDNANRVGDQEEAEHHQLLKDWLQELKEYRVINLNEDYDPPYNAEQIKQNYGDKIYNKLKNDPVHRWRMETGIELIHKEPTKEEQDRIWKNWQLMTDEQKRISDKKSLELFGITNEEHNKQLAKSMNEDLETDSDQDVLSSIYSPEELLDWMKSTITYDANDDPCQTPEQLLQSKQGHCFEQTWLEEEFF